MTKGPVVILGAGGHARVIVEALKAIGYKTGILLDDDSSKWTGGVGGWSCVTGPITPERLKQWASMGVEFIVGVGNVDAKGCALRDKLYLMGMDAKWLPVTVIHRSAILLGALGHGVFIGPRAVVMPGAVVGSNSIINTGAIVEHDCKVGDSCHIATGAILCGGVRVGNKVHVGAGAIVKQGVKIGDGATIGMGAVVLNDVLPEDTMVGNPDRVLSPWTL